jgi:type II secretion system protein N
VFTVLKIPEHRHKNFSQGSIAAALSSKGVTFTAAESSISFLFGVTYEMKDVTLNPPPPQPSVRIDRIRVSPSLFSLLVGRIGGTVRLEQGDGSLKGTFAMKSPQSGSGEFSFSFQTKDLNLGRLAVLPIAAGIQGGMVVSGEGSISGDLQQPSTLNGELKLQLSRVVLAQQAVMGFSIPRVAIADGAVEIGFAQSKAAFKTFRLGKPGGADDLHANVTGEVVLGNRWDTSNLNVKAKFGLSQAAAKSFGFFLTLLDAGKQADGTYAYSITGPVRSPVPAPIK